MVAQPSLFKLIRSGNFVVFPCKHVNRSLSKQLSETFECLDSGTVAQVLAFLSGTSNEFPEVLTPKQRLFFRAVRNGQIVKGA